MWWPSMPVAICTAAPPANIALACERFGLGEQVDTITSPADGLRGKPHPDIFLEAARRLGTTPSRTMVLEDSFNGVRAGAAAIWRTGRQIFGFRVPERLYADPFHRP